MQFTKEDMQIIMWKDIVLNSLRNANFTTVSDSENISVCKKKKRLFFTDGGKIPR